VLCRACLTKQGRNDDWCTWGYSIILGKQWCCAAVTPEQQPQARHSQSHYHYRCNTLPMWTATQKIRACHFTLHDSTGKDMCIVTASWQLFVGFPFMCRWKYYVERILQRDIAVQARWRRQSRPILTDYPGESQ
jgi:hypothetical protein